MYRIYVDFNRKVSGDGSYYPTLPSLSGMNSVGNNSHYSAHGISTVQNQQGNTANISVSMLSVIIFSQADFF